MKIKAIETNQAPQALGPYSQGVQWNNFIFPSMQIAINPNTQEVVKGGIEAQTRQIFKNIQAILNEAGSNLSKAVKVTVFLKNMADFKKVNEIYAHYFNKPFPARSAVGVKELPLSVDIAIEVIATC